MIPICVWPGDDFETPGLRKSFIIALVLMVVLGLLAVFTDVFDWRFVPHPAPSRY